MILSTRLPLPESAYLSEIVIRVPVIEGGQATQWPKETGQKDKQWNKKHYSEKLEIEQHETHQNPGGELMCSGGVGSSVPNMASVV